jgi:hypothetical protein
MSKKKTLKQLIKDLEAEELREIILEAAGLDKKIEKYLRMFIAGSDKTTADDLLAEAYTKINSFFFNRRGFPKVVKVAEVKSVLNEFANLLQHYPGHTLQLKLKYIENCLEMLGFGEDDRVSNSALSVLREISYLLCDNPDLYLEFSKRFDGIVTLADGAGWVSETICEEVWDIEEKFGNNDDGENENNDGEEDNKESIKVIRDIPIFRIK